MLLSAGALLGAVLGLAHAVYVYRVVATNENEKNIPGALYFGVWTWVLWVIFGVYVLVLWVVGAFLYLIFKAFR